MKPQPSNEGCYIAQKRTRHERKMARNAIFQHQAKMMAQYQKEHPILSGAITITNYVPPNGHTRQALTLSAADGSEWLMPNKSY